MDVPRVQDVEAPVRKPHTPPSMMPPLHLLCRRHPAQHLTQGPAARGCRLEQIGLVHHRGSDLPDSNARRDIRQTNGHRQLDPRRERRRQRRHDSVARPRDVVDLRRLGREMLLLIVPDQRHSIFRARHQHRPKPEIPAQALRGGHDRLLGLHRHFGGLRQFLPVGRDNVCPGIGRVVPSLRIDDHSAVQLVRSLDQPWREPPVSSPLW